MTTANLERAMTSGVLSVREEAALGRTWPVFGAALLLVFLVHLSTLTISPTLWTDEAMIIEWGRLVLDPGSDWSILWLEEGRPSRFLGYVGPLLQEISFTLAGESVAGPRLFALLGALVAAVAMLGWLLRREVPRLAAMGLSLVFLLDPLFVRGYRGGRVDSWAIAFCLLACWVLRAYARAAPGSRRTGAAVLAGALAAAAPFFWPSALVLYPLVLVELIGFVVAARRETSSGMPVLAGVSAFGAGGVLLTAALLLPMGRELLEIVQIMLTPVAAKQNDVSLVGQAVAVVKTLSLNPLLLLAAPIALLLRKDMLLAAALGLGVAVVVGSHAYSHRVVYLLPYLIVITAGLFVAREPGSRPGMWKHVETGLLVGLLLWGVGLSLVLRTLMAAGDREGRAPETILDAGRQAVGTGAHRVLIDPFELYSAGRQLGWKLYRPYLEYDSAATQRLYASVDYAIVGARERKVKRSDLEQAGLQLAGTLLPTDDGARRSGGFLAWLRSRGGARNYGPYLLYRR